jgi:hypothetical protein
MTHLVDQQYDICIRRTRSYCSVCYTPYIISTADGTGSSYGLSSGSVAATQTNAIGSICNGVTIVGSAAASTNTGHGDYLEIANMQPSPGTTAKYGGTDTFRICGGIFNIIAAQTAGASICSFTVPFKVGVHMDDAENIGAGTVTADFTYENDISWIAGAGHGYAGFYLSYWQRSC